jgi:hypothetical protein
VRTIRPPSVGTLDLDDLAQAIALGGVLDAARDADVIGVGHEHEVAAGAATGSR